MQHGFDHFDTAPLYGYGLAEKDLSVILARHSHVGVTTKVGIYSPGGENQSNLSVLTRKFVGKVFPALSRAVVDTSIERARQSLGNSLARLRRERVELCLIHEPDAALLATDEWQRWLESEVRTGRIGEWGYAANNQRLRHILSAGTVLPPVIQTDDSLDKREADCLVEFGRPLQITHSYISSAIRRSRGPVDVATVIKQALRRNLKGAIIVSTGKERRIQQFAKALSET